MMRRVLDANPSFVSIGILAAAFAPAKMSRASSALDASVQKVYAREILDSRGNPTVEVSPPSVVHPTTTSI